MPQTKRSGDGPPKVTCWYCGAEVFKRRTRRLPNGARVCVSHKCDVCEDYARPENATVLTKEGEPREHVCSTHRRYLVDHKRDEYILTDGIEFLEEFSCTKHL